MWVPVSDDRDFLYVLLIAKVDVLFPRLVERDAVLRTSVIHARLLETAPAQCEKEIIALARSEGPGYYELPCFWIHI